MTSENQKIKNASESPTNDGVFIGENVSVNEEGQTAPTLALSCVPKINGALYFNDFRIFNALDVSNDSERELVDLRIDFRATPEFFEPFSICVDRVAPGERLRVDRFDISLNFKYLASISEETRGEIRVEAFENASRRPIETGSAKDVGSAESAENAENVGDANSRDSVSCEKTLEFPKKSPTPIVSEKFPIAVCANDEWFGAVVLPSLLAAYVTPNVDGIARLQTEVAEILQEQGLKSSLEGYQARDKNRVYEMVRAAYQAVVRRQIHYANPPASFGLTGQRVRFPDKILRDKLGTCLDLSLLFASLLEQCGLHPLILLYAGHAFVGCHLREACLRESFDDNLQALRKLAELDEVVVFETTLATVGGSASFNVAENVARKRLADDESFVGTLDVRRARVERVRPIPLRRDADDRCEIDFEVGKKAKKSAQTPVDEARRLVPDWEPIDVQPATPKTRVDRWKQNLLDLSVRNKLLNCKRSQVVDFLFPESRLGALEDRLVDGETFSIFPARSLKTGDSVLRDLAAIERREGRDMLDVLLDEEFKRGALLAWPSFDEAELGRRLTKIFRDAETNLNEGGVNTLFLALGMVERVADRDGKIYRAPFLLIPMKLERLPKQKGFALTRSDEDASINVTLLELLRRDHNKTIPGIDPKNLPSDEKGVDVDKIFQIFQRELVELDGWELRKDICLGNFFFQKFVMWADLNDHMTELVETPLVKHLVFSPKERFDDGIPETRSEDVDSGFSTDEILAPLSADSSQIAALLTAAAGKNFVLQGPPGAGKSQTIANTIAHCLAQGKTTLFVAEKRAALDVVHRRLCGLGLEPFCLELHSNKSGKRRLLEQLQSALEFSQKAAIKDWTSVTREIETLKKQLNEYVAELHREYPNGRTLYDAIARLSETEPWRDKTSKLRLRSRGEALTNVSPERFAELLTIGDYVASALGNIEENVWTELRDFGATDWTPRWNREVVDAARATKKAAQNLRADVANLLELVAGKEVAFGDAAPQIDDFATFARLAETVARAGSATPRGFFSDAPRETAILFRRWIRLDEAFETTRASLERAGLRQLVNLGKTTLKERLATNRAGFRFDLAKSANACESDGEVGAESAEVREFNAFVSRLVMSVSEIVQKLGLETLNPAAFGRFVDERRLEETRRLTSALRLRPAPTSSFLGADWSDFATTARRLASLGRRRDAERSFFAGFDVEKLTSNEPPQVSFDKGFGEISAGAFAWRGVKKETLGRNVALPATNEEKNAEAPDNQGELELEAAGFSRVEAERLNALRTTLDETLQTLDELWNEGAEVFSLYNISDSMSERVASLYRALLGATATEISPPTDVFLASDWSDFSPAARKLVALSRKRDALARQIAGYDASTLLAFNVNRALEDVSGVPEGVWKLRGVQKNVDATSISNDESNAVNDAMSRGVANEEGTGTFGAALKAFLPALDGLVDATSKAARRLGLREEESGEKAAVFSRRLLDAVRDFDLPLSLLGSDDWSEFCRRGRDAIEMARAREIFLATSGSVSLEDGDDAGEERRFEETTRRAAEDAEANALIFAAKGEKASRWNATAWSEVVESLRTAGGAELDASREYDEASSVAADFEPTALKNFDVAEGRRLVEAATNGFFLFRAKSKKKAFEFFEKHLRPERLEAFKSTFSERSATVCNEIERWQNAARRRDETREALRGAVEASRDLARREQEQWDKEVEEFATYCERWDWRIGVGATIDDWNRFDKALDAGVCVADILAVATDNEAERRRVVDAVVALAGELRNASKNDKDATRELSAATNVDGSQSALLKGLDDSQAAVAAFFAPDSATEENASSETAASVDEATIESPAVADARLFDENWKRFAEKLGPFLCSFKTWNEEFALAQREIQASLATWETRLGDLVARNARIDADALSKALDAGDAIFERVKTTLGVNSKQIPTVLNYLGKSWRASASVDSKKGAALRSWLDAWTRFEKRCERLAPLYASWKAERDEETKEFEVGFAAYRSRFETSQPISWSGLEEALDVGDQIVAAAFALATDGRNENDEGFANERLARFWPRLNEFWGLLGNALNDEKTETCVAVDRFLELWGEYDVRTAKFVEALKKTTRVQPCVEKRRDDSNVEIQEDKNVENDDADEANGARRDAADCGFEFSIAQILGLDASLDAEEKDAFGERDESERRLDDATSATLNLLTEGVLRCVLTRVQTIQTERRLGANAAFLYSNGKRDATAALEICDATSAFERLVRFLDGEELDAEASEKDDLSQETAELYKRCGLALDAVLERGAQGEVDERAEAIRRGLETLKTLETQLNDTTSFRGRRVASQGEEYLENRLAFADVVLRNERNFQFWNRWNRLQVSVAQEFPGLVEAVERREIASDEVAPILRRSLFAQFADEIVDASPTLRYFVGDERERLIERFRELDARRSELTQRLIIAKLASRLPAARTGENALSAEETNALTFLQREIGKKRHVRSIRQMLDEMRPIFSTLKPCLLMSPLSVAQYVPANGEKYDVIIFDEASQIPVWDAVGAIARGTQLIVVGDSKQLPPTGFFQRQNDDEAVGDEVEETESILDECVASQIPARMLNWHYRSRRESLIAFSNRRYYDGKLTTFPSPRNDSLGVQLRFVENGLYEKGGSKTNKPEANALVKEVVARLRSPEFAGKSLGVVTFNEAQRRLIEDLLDDARQDYPEIEPFFDSSSPEPTFVKNLENVQGDERDVIYFSIGYGPDVNGVVSMNFGPLNAEGGERRLNVAITRAKEENVVFSSIRANQIDLSRTQKRGPNDLRAFLEYAESGGAFLFDASGADSDANDFAFERSVADFLRSKGLEIVERVGRSRSRVDLAVVAPGTKAGKGEYAVAIECDGTTYASAATARDRDVLRSRTLENLGWQTVRVWATDWLFDRTGAQERLERDVAAALERWRKAEDEGEKTRASQSWVASQVEVGEGVSVGNNANFEAADGGESVYPSVDYATSPNFAETLDKQERFYDPAFRGTLRRQMREIIDVESPITEALLFKRMRTLWGFARAGEKIRETLRAATPRDATAIRDGDGDVFWKADANPREYDGYRVPSETSNSREFAEIPTVELVNALKAVANELGSWDDEEAIFRETAKKLGACRLTQPVRNRLTETIKNVKNGLK